MERKKRRHGGHIKRIGAAALAALAVFSASVWDTGGTAEAGGAGTKDSPRLTVGIAGYGDLSGEEKAERADLKVTVDLYLVAAAVEVPGYDDYDWEVTEGYKDHREPGEALSFGEKFRNALAPPEKPDGSAGSTANADWRALADEAAGIALGAAAGTGENGEKRFVFDGSGKAASYTVELNSDNGFRSSDLEGASAPGQDFVPEKGIYLLVPHGSGLEPEAYAVCAEDDTGTVRIAGMARAGGKVYRYLPELVSVPAPDAVGKGWVYDTAAELKYETEEEYVSLEIVKNVRIPEDAEGGEDHFVYRIEAEYNGRNVYSDVVELTLPAGETSVSSESLPPYRDGKRPLHKIAPAGSKITVTEVYTGTSYTYAGASAEGGAPYETLEDGIRITSAAPDGKEGDAAGQDGKIIPGNRVAFTNTCTGSSRSSDAAENRFVYEGEGWEWQNNPDGSRK